MNFAALKRDAGVVGKAFKELEDNSLVALKEARVYFPARFTEQHLATVEVETYCIGHFAIVVDNCYAYFNVNAMVRFDPAEVNKVVWEDEEYYELVFFPGSIVIPNLMLAKVDTNVYHIYNGILSKGRIPWYISYDDLMKIFTTAPEFAGASVGSEHEVIEVLVSLIARNPNNPTEYFRTIAGKEGAPDKPLYISFKSVEYAATNTTNKLGGANFARGVVAALVDPSTRLERIETSLRV